MSDYTDIKSSFLFRRLEEYQQEKLIACAKFLMDIWDAPHLINYYTEHGYYHSTRILSKIQSLPEFESKSADRLEGTDIYILLLAVIFHDIGMQCDLGVYTNVKKRVEVDFKVKFESEFKGEFTRENMIELRKFHHLVTSAWLKEAKKTNNSSEELHSILLSIDEEILSSVCIVCQYHSKIDIKQCPRNDMGTDKLRLLAALLRLGDELDIDKKRVNPVVPKSFYIPCDSSLYYYLHL